MPLIPGVIPDGVEVTSTAPAITANPGNYDFLLNGVGWHFAISQDDPYTETDVEVLSRQPQTDNAPGDQSLTDWWRSSQASFHGGAGQRWREPTVPNQWAASRFDSSFNCWPFEPGQVTRLPATGSVLTLPASTQSWAVAGSNAGLDYALVAQGAALTRLAFASSSAMTATSTSITWPNSATAVLSLVTDGDTYWVSTNNGTNIHVLRGSVNSGNPVVIYETTGADVILGWAKGHLVAAQGRNVFDLDANIAASTNALPSASWTHSSPTWVAAGFAESPSGILVGGTSGSNGRSDVIELGLDASAAVPVLAGGAQVLELPTGERVLSLRTLAGSFLAIGTNRGVRIATWNGFTSRVELGPLSVETTQPVRCVEARGDYFYAGATAMLNGDDLESGLLAVAPGSVVDENGRRGWAAHQVPPTPLAGTVFAVTTLPTSGRLLFTVGSSVLVEGLTPGGSREAWLRTSRIRLGTNEPKLFKWARLRGTVSAASIGAYVITPDGDGEDERLSVTFAGIEGDPDEFRLMTVPSEWVALRFVLGGDAVRLNGYQVTGLPAPRRQFQFNFKALCFESEKDRKGSTGRHPMGPRQRWRGVQEIASSGREVQFTVYDRRGPITYRVTVERAKYTQADPPSTSMSFGGTVEFLLRTTEGAA